MLIGNIYFDNVRDPSRFTHPGMGPGKGQIRRSRSGLKISQKITILIFRIEVDQKSVNREFILIMFETPVGLLIREWDPVKDRYVDPGLVFKISQNNGFLWKILPIFAQNITSEKFQSMLAFY